MKVKFKEKTIKKVVSLLMIVMLVVTVIPVPTQATDSNMTVQDISEITGVYQKMLTTAFPHLGTMKSATNVAVKMKVDANATFTAGGIGFYFANTTTNPDMNSGYYIVLRSGDILLNQGSEMPGYTTWSRPTGQFELEIGTEENADGTSRTVYVKVNGSEVLSCTNLDNTWPMGQNLVMWRGDARILTSCTQAPTVNVQDIYELTNTVDKSCASGAFHTLGAAKNANNNAVKMKVVLPKTLADGATLGFNLSCPSNGFDNNQGYYITMSYDTVTISKAGTTISDVKHTTAPGTEFYLELGIYEELNSAGNTVYVKINNTLVNLGTDTEASTWTLGNYLHVYRGQAVNFKPYYDESAAQAQDISEITNVYQKMLTTTFPHLGTMKSATNVAVKMKVDMTKTLANGAQLGFYLSNATTNPDANSGYYIVLNSKVNVILQRGGTTVTQPTYDAPTGEFELEIGTVEGIEGSSRKIYVKIDGSEVLSWIDTDIANWPMGNNLTMYRSCVTTLKSCTQAPTVNVQDIYELTNTVDKSCASNAFHTLGAAKNANNNAVKMKVVLPKTLAEGATLAFNLSCPSSSFDNNQGYYVILSSNTVTIQKAGADKLSLIHTTAPGTEFYLEIGIYEELNSAGNTVYVKINNTLVFLWTDTEASEWTLGNYLHVYRAQAVNFVADYSEAEVNVQDLYTVTGKTDIEVVERYILQYIGTTADTSNYAIKMNVKQNTSGMRFILSTTGAGESEPSTGYNLTLLPTVVAIKPLNATTDLAALNWSVPTSSDSYTVEIGIVDLMFKDKTVGRKIYIKVNGTEILSAIDEAMTVELGKNFLYLTNDTTNTLSSLAQFYPASEGYTLQYDATDGAYTYAAGTTLTSAGDYTCTWSEDNVNKEQIIVIYNKGDINADNKINVLDIVALKKNLDDSVGRNLTASGTKAKTSLTSADQVKELRSLLLGYDTSNVTYVATGLPSYSTSEVMTIGAYHGPQMAGGKDYTANFKSGSTYEVDPDTYTERTITTDFINDTEFAKFKAAGFNTVIGDASFNIETYRNADIKQGMLDKLSAYLTCANRNGVDVIMTPIVASNYLCGSTDDWGTTKAELKGIVDEFGAFPNLRGILMGDEFNDRNPDSDTAVYRYQKALSYINNPLGRKDLSKFTMLTGETTDIDFWMENVGVINGNYQYDCYPFRMTDSNYSFSRDNWFNYLETTASSASKYNVPNTGIAIQSCGIASTAGQGWYEIQSQSQIDFQVYSALAYGMKSIHYYTYWENSQPLATAPSGFQFVDCYYTQSMVEYPEDGGTESVTTELYDWVADTNNTILSYDHVLLDYTWKGTMTLESTGVTSTYKNHRINAASTTGPAIIGCMKDSKGFDGFMLVNAAEPYNYTTGKDAAETTVTVKFNNTTRIMIYDGTSENGRIETITDGLYSAELAAGKGVFAIPLV